MFSVITFYCFSIQESFNLGETWFPGHQSYHLYFNLFNQVMVGFFPFLSLCINKILASSHLDYYILDKYQEDILSDINQACNLILYFNT